MKQRFHNKFTLVNIKNTGIFINRYEMNFRYKWNKNSFIDDEYEMIVNRIVNMIWDL